MLQNFPFSHFFHHKRAGLESSHNHKLVLRHGHHGLVQAAAALCWQLQGRRQTEGPGCQIA